MMKIGSFVLRYPWLYTIAGNVFRWIVPKLPRKVLYSRLNIWGRQRDLPPIPKKSFRQLYRDRSRDGQ
jgi:L-lactate dehydrogenase complex protein LldF